MEPHIYRFSVLIISCWEGRSAFKILIGKPTWKRPLEGLDVEGRTILECILKKYISIRGTRLVKLRIEIFGEPLWKQHWTSGFHKPWSELVIISCFIQIYSPVHTSHSSALCNSSITIICTIIFIRIIYNVLPTFPFCATNYKTHSIFCSLVLLNLMFRFHFLYISNFFIFCIRFAFSLFYMMSIFMPLFFLYFARTITLFSENISLLIFSHIFGICLFNVPFFSVLVSTRNTGSIALFQ